MEGVISTLNSTTSLLNASTDFTGSFESCQHFTEIMVSIYQQQFAFNVRINWSHDGSTVWDSEVLGALPSRSAASLSYFVVPVKAAYFRVAYSNGTSNQTVFNLQTILKYTGSYGNLNLPRLGNVIYNGEVYPLQIAYVNAATGAGTYAIIAATAGKVNRVWQANLTIAVAGTVGWNRGANVIVQPQAFPASGQFNWRGVDNTFLGVNTGTVNEAINLVTTGASQIVRGSVLYILSNS